MKLIRRIGIGLSVLVLVVICGALVLFNWSATGWKALTVQTGSMRPSVPVGSLVLMHRVPLSSLKVGDVITYTNLNKKGTTITHRIIRTYKINNKIPAFITKGDANQTADQPVVGGLVLGKSVWHTPHLGSWLNQTKKPYIILPMIYIPALVIVIEEIRRLSDYYKKQLPYRIVGYEPPKDPKGTGTQLVGKFAGTMKLAIVFVIAFSVIAVPTVHALLKSNTVALTPNRLTVAKKPPTTCNGTGSSNSNTNISITGSGNSNSNNVNVNNTTNQNSSTGNATSTGGGSATSGNASNTNCTNINITITNHH